MKIKIALVVFLLSLMAGSCGYFRHKKAASDTTDFPMLDSALIMKYDTVKVFFPSTDAIYYARKLYNDAVETLDKKKDAPASLPLFLRSLRIAPEQYKYLRYADALYASGDYATSSCVYFYFNSLDEENNSQALLGFAKSEAMKHNDYALEYLSHALAKYPFDVDEIKEDKAFERFHDKEEFKILMAKYKTDDASRKKALMAVFEKNFTLGTLPFSIPQYKLFKHDGRHIDIRFADFISDLSEMEMGEETSSEFQYYARLNLSQDYKTFIYTKVHYQRDTLYPVHFFLMTVDLDDSLIAQQEIACGCSPFTLKSAMIDTAGVIEVKETEQTWKEDPLYKGYANNSIVKQELKSVTYYQVGEDGSIKLLGSKPK